MKTALELFHELPEEIMQKAVENTMAEHKPWADEFLYSKWPNVWEALKNAFVWENTPEKHDFWEKIYIERKKQFLKSL